MITKNAFNLSHSEGLIPSGLSITFYEKSRSPSESPNLVEGWTDPHVQVQFVFPSAKPRWTVFEDLMEFLITVK
jgi:hypothetical protein